MSAFDWALLQHASTMFLGQSKPIIVSRMRDQHFGFPKCVIPNECVFQRPWV